MDPMMLNALAELSLAVVLVIVSMVTVKIRDVAKRVEESREHISEGALKDLQASHDKALMQLDEKMDHLSVILGTIQASQQASLSSLASLDHRVSLVERDIHKIEDK